jgi:hypothetical protein
VYKVDEAMAPPCVIFKLPDNSEMSLSVSLSGF